jgi:hypothetical protein
MALATRTENDFHRNVTNLFEVLNIKVQQRYIFSQQTNIWI